MSANINTDPYFSSRLLGVPIITSDLLPRDERGERSYARPLWRRLLEGRLNDITTIPGQAQTILMVDGRVVVAPDVLDELRALLGGDT